MASSRAAQRRHGRARRDGRRDRLSQRVGRSPASWRRGDGGLDATRTLCLCRFWWPCRRLRPGAHFSTEPAIASSARRRRRRSSTRRLTSLMSRRGAPRDHAGRSDRSAVPEPRGTLRAPRRQVIAAVTSRLEGLMARLVFARQPPGRSRCRRPGASTPLEEDLMGIVRLVGTRPCRPAGARTCRRGLRAVAARRSAPAPRDCPWAGRNDLLASSTNRWERDSPQPGRSLS